MATIEIETAASPSADERNATIGFYSTGKRIRHWSGFGALWGALWGAWWVLVDLFWIPGIGHITTARWFAASLTKAAGAAAVGSCIGAIAAALIGVGLRATRSSMTRTPSRVDVHMNPES